MSGYDFSKDNNISGLWKLYLIMALIAGSILVFLTPVYEVPDEANHFYRAWQISEGSFLSPAVKNQEDGKIYLTAFYPKVFSSNETDTGNFDDIKNFLNTPVNYESITSSEISNTGAYTPLGYFPQALICFIARLLNCNAGVIFYAMRFAALIFAVVCVCLSMRLLPEQNLLIFLIGIMPMFMFECASVSCDPIIYGVCFLSAAYLFYLAKSENEIKPVQIFALITIALSIGLLKQIYGTILLLYFFIPYQRFKTKTKFFAFGLFLMALCIAVSLLWLHISVKQFNAELTILEGVADFQRQKDFIFSEPGRFIQILFTSRIKTFTADIARFIGILGRLNVILARWFYPVYALLLLFAAFTIKIRLGFFQRVIMIFGVMASIFAMDIFFYLTWTAVESNIIFGFQGRYLIPLSLLIFPVISCGSGLKNRTQFYTALTAGIISISVTLYGIFNFYYEW